MGAIQRVSGHTLAFEGAPYSSPECGHGACTDESRVLRLHSMWGGVGGDGHGRCSCGAESDHLTSGAARKAWHREHKRQVAEEESV